MQSNRIFISYSHSSESDPKSPRWKEELTDSLKVFTDHNLIDAWDDEQIPGGYRWFDEIREALHQARVAILLLTEAALKSQFILEHEFKPLSAREPNQLLVFPILCEECSWREHSWLKDLQIRRFQNKPLSACSDSERAKVWRRLATEIAEEVSKIALSALPTTTTAHADTRVFRDRFQLPRGPSRREETLIGREQELALLDLAFAQPDTAIVTLVAWGGVGKTMLVQHWLKRLQDEDRLGALRVYAWSFYSQGSAADRQTSEDPFLTHALQWFGVKCEPTLSPLDKGRLLADAVSAKPTLLILDGVEPLQYPPGPLGGQLRKVGEDESRLRAPGLQSLLKQLAAKAKRGERTGMCLVTTRVWLADLNDHKRSKSNPTGSVLRVVLGNLIDEAGAALLYQAGTNRAGAAKIEPQNEELLAASREVDGHALTLNLLGRFLASAYGGDILRRDLVKFEEADRREQGGTTFKMLAAFERWFADDNDFGARPLALLRMLGLFDRPADAGCIGALRQLPVIGGLTDALFTKTVDASTGQITSRPLIEQSWNQTVYLLVEYSLIVIQGDTDDRNRLLDCHPLIREYFASKLEKTNLSSWNESNIRLATYFEEKPKDVCPTSQPEMEFLFQAVGHRARGNDLQKAFQTFEKRILGNDYYVTKRMGMLAEVWATCHTLLNRGAGKSEPRIRAVIQRQLGYSARAIGFMDEAVTAFKVGLQAQNKAELAEMSISAGLLAVTQLYAGELKDGLIHARQAVEYARGAAFPPKFMYAMSSLGKLEFYSGKFDAAEEHLRHAVRMIAEPSNQIEPGNCTNAWFRFGEWLLWRKDYQTALDITNEALAFSEEKKTGPMFKALLQTNKAYALMRQDSGRSNRDEVSYLVNEALNNYKKGALDNETIRGHLLSVEFHCQYGRVADGQAHLDEAWDMAERGPMRLHMADIHLHRARLFAKENSYPWTSPQTDLAAAEKLIIECGYHRRDEELADAKRAR